MPRLVALLLFAFLTAPLSAAPPPPSDLVDYVKKKDGTFAWKRTGAIESETGVVYDLDLTSQKWQGIEWTHKLQVYVPKGVKPRATMVLWNQGGTPNLASGFLGLQLATKIGAPVAFLYGIPNQPLFGGKREDALIAETFVRYLETGDSTWPLLFPMVKSITRAMDALQAFARAEWQYDVTHFVVTGASKRGWTSWLTAATGDKRVKAIAPLVIDTLNFPAQMKNQVRAFGKPSLMVYNYVERKLIPIPETAAAQKLWKMVDPWIYRDAITVPKMIINGANDPYWPLDALNSYWDDLKGEKYLLYVPNAGHDLREADKDGAKQLLPSRAVNALSAFCKCQVFDKPMPKMTWKIVQHAGHIDWEAEFQSPWKKQRIHMAQSDSRDFRKARWSDHLFVESAAGTTNGAGMSLNKPAKGYSAGFLEMEFDVDGLPLPLTTQLRIFEAKK